MKGDWWKALAGLAVLAVVALGFGLLFRGQGPTPMATEPTTTEVATQTVVPATPTGTPLPTLTPMATPMATTAVQPTAIQTVEMPLVHTPPLVKITPDVESVVHDLDGIAYVWPTYGAVLSWPQWSPDGSKLLYTAGSPIHVVLYDIEAASVTAIAQGDWIAPRWNARWDRIVFIKRRTKVDWEIWMVRPDGTDLTWLADADSYFLDLSPSGTVYFVTKAGLLTVEITEALKGGTPTANVLLDSQTLLSLGFDFFTEKVGSRANLTLSPDGRKLALHDSDQLLIMDTETGQVTEIPVPCGTICEDEDPLLEPGLGQLYWSPDAGRLAVSVEGILENEVWIIDLVGSAEPVLLPGGAMTLDLDWSDDGQKLAGIGLDIGSDGWLLIADGDGRHARSFELPVGLNSFISWSPDGRKLASDCEDAESAGLCIIEVDRIKQYLNWESK